MSASRLKGKPLLEINNLPIICHVVKKAKETGIGKVIVATEDKEIVVAVEKNDGKAILTGNHKTGTDRIFEAFQKLKITDVEYVVNLQGDEPMIDPNDIINLNNLMIKNNSDIGTLASEVKEDSILNNENIVKVITKEKLENNKFTKALNFSRKNLSKQNSNIYHHIGIYAYKVSVLEKFINFNQTKNEIENRLEQLRALDNNNFTKALNFSRKDLSKQDSNIYHHIGIYAYKVSVLEKFINFNQTKNEVKNRLEQLRALDNNITIMVALAKSSPIGIDTKEDYLAIKKIMEYKS